MPKVRNVERCETRIVKGVAYKLLILHYQISILGGEDEVWELYRDGVKITAPKEAERLRLRVFGKAR